MKIFAGCQNSRAESLPKRRNEESSVDTVGMSMGLSVPGARCHAALNAAVSALFDACQQWNRHWRETSHPW